MVQILRIWLIFLRVDERDCFFRPENDAWREFYLGFAALSKGSFFNVLDWFPSKNSELRQHLENVCRIAGTLGRILNQMLDVFLELRHPFKDNFSEVSLMNTA